MADPINGDCSSHGLRALQPSSTSWRNLCARAPTPILYSFRGSKLWTLDLAPHEPEAEFDSFDSSITAGSRLQNPICPHHRYEGPVSIRPSLMKCNLLSPCYPSLLWYYQRCSLLVIDTNQSIIPECHRSLPSSRFHEAAWERSKHSFDSESIGEKMDELMTGKKLGLAWDKLIPLVVTPSTRRDAVCAHLCWSYSREDIVLRIGAVKWGF